MQRWRASCLRCRLLPRCVATQHIRCATGTAEATGGTSDNALVVGNVHAWNQALAIQTIDDDPTPSRHYLRHILRECTYLPDPNARTWMAKHVVSSFRRYSYTPVKYRTGQSNATEQSEAGPRLISNWFRERLKAKREKARQAKYQLRRANEGERALLIKIFLMVYGQTGKRRAELMKPLANVNSTEGVGDSKESIAHRSKTQSIGEDKHRAASALNLSAQLRALLESQVKCQPPALVGSNPRQIDPKVPRLNEWHQPMSLRRVRNLARQRHAKLLRRVNLPLPTDEWLHLWSLARGDIHAQPIPRRKGLSIPKMAALETVVRHAKAPKAAFENRKAHSLTPRYMQRIYAQVFRQVPLMQWNTAKKKWKVTWGHHALHGLDHPLAAGSPKG